MQDTDALVAEYLDNVKQVDPKAHLDAKGNVCYRTFTMDASSSTDVQITEVCDTPQIITELTRICQVVYDNHYHQPVQCYAA